MRASISDLETLRSINPDDVSAYLTSRGWKKRQDISETASLWTTSLKRSERELFLPQKPDYRDFPARIIELIKILEDVENRSQLEIIDDIKTSRIHVIRIRVDNPEIVDGAIPIYDGVQLFDSTKRLMWSVAKSSEKPEPILHGGREYSNVKSYLNNLRFGKSETGSYILKVLSPLGSFHSSTEDSFGNKVVRTLFESLNRISDLSISFLDRNDLEIINSLVMTGVSANLVDSLISMNEISSRGNLDFNLSKAASFQKTMEIPSTASITKDNIPFLSEVSKRLKSKELKKTYESTKQRLLSGEVLLRSQPLLEEVVSPQALPQRVRIEGSVTHLEWSSENASPRVTILASLDGEIKEITVEVSPEEFLLATQAHIEKHRIVCDGTLFFDHGLALIRQPSTFEII